MNRPSRIDWTGEREKRAQKVRLVVALSFATIIMVTLGALYLSKISQSAAGQPARYSEIIGGALMYDVAESKESRRAESRST